MCLSKSSSTVADSKSEYRDVEPLTSERRAVTGTAAHGEHSKLWLHRRNKVPVTKKPLRMAMHKLQHAVSWLAFNPYKNSRFVSKLMECFHCCSSRCRRNNKKNSVFMQTFWKFVTSPSWSQSKTFSKQRCFTFWIRRKCLCFGNICNCTFCFKITSVRVSKQLPVFLWHCFFIWQFHLCVICFLCNCKHSKQKNTHFACQLSWIYPRLFLRGGHSYIVDVFK